MELGVLTGTERPSELPPLFPGIWSPREPPRNDLETPLVVYCRHVVGRSLVGSTGPGCALCVGGDCITPPGASVQRQGTRK
jgi:hypothetical protein